IRLRTILNDRRQLLDIGAAGPIAGFVVALPVLWIGLLHSQHAVQIGPGSMMIESGWGEIWLGDSLITLWLRRLTDIGAGTVVLHPAAFAGWLGMFVTMLNLLPIGQLDGGHILYSAAPRSHRYVARVFWVAVILLGYYSKSWLAWGIIV